MGKLGGFLEITRAEPPERDPRHRTRDFHEFVQTLPLRPRQCQQLGRCR